MKLSEIRDLLSARGIRLTKSLGQNFLHDANQLRRIVAAAELSPADRVLEIGPGLGPLTEQLVARAGMVLAIEKDARLVAVLRERLAAFATAPTPKLKIVGADALEWLRRDPRDWRGWKLVANLPYSVASPLLVELARAPEPPDRLVVTLQWEVARRLLAHAGDPDYGLLTLLLQRAYRPRDAFKIPASCFFPKPDVDSACVTLVRREPPLLPPALRSHFEPIVKRAFSQRRKMMRKLLQADWPADRLAAAWNALGFSPAVRAEQVSLEQFAALTRMLAAW